MVPEIQRPAIDFPAPEPPEPAGVVVAPAVAAPRAKRGLLRRLWLPLSALAIAYVAWQVLTWPDVAALAKTNPQSTAFIDEYRDRWFFPDRKVEWKWVPYSRISRNLRRAVLVGEDATFFGHEGFDTDEMRAALEEAIQKHRLPRGASTITQQVAKNLWLSPSRNPLRKVKEALLTGALERHLTKRRILEIYLNVSEFGAGIYGAEAASRHYFHHSAASLSSHEAAQLAAALPSPKHWYPGSGSRAYAWRVRWIERRMWRTGWISGRA